MKPLNWLAILLIQIYQRTLSQRLYQRGVRCLHYPSCSQYAALAYQKYGFLKATQLAWCRYWDCQPFSGRPYIDYP
jgi:putative component of membrane protein insertase Oxa1/YidC/SpoIIIJ protein YidD